MHTVCMEPFVCGRHTIARRQLCAHTILRRNPTQQTTPGEGMFAHCVCLEPLTPMLVLQMRDKKQEKPRRRGDYLVESLPTVGAAHAIRPSKVSLGSISPPWANHLSPDHQPVKPRGESIISLRQNTQRPQNLCFLCFQWNSSQQRGLFKGECMFFSLHQGLAHGGQCRDGYVQARRERSLGQSCAASGDVHLRQCAS